MNFLLLESVHRVVETEQRQTSTIELSYHRSTQLFGTIAGENN